jgi:hypothetical protein
LQYRTAFDVKNDLAAAQSHVFGVFVRAERTGTKSQYTVFLADRRLAEGGELAVVLNEVMCPSITTAWRNCVVCVSHLYRNDFNQLFASSHSKLALVERAETGPFVELQCWADATFESAIEVA